MSNRFKWLDIPKSFEAELGERVYVIHSDEKSWYGIGTYEIVWMKRNRSLIRLKQVDSKRKMLMNNLAYSVYSITQDELS